MKGETEFQGIEMTMANIPADDIKAEAHELIDTLPENATWDDVMYRIYVRQCIEAGLSDVERGHTVDIAEVRRQFSLQP
jgi:hypothetical protein